VSVQLITQNQRKIRKFTPKQKLEILDGAYESDTKTKLFYLFLIAQICAIFAMVVGILFLSYGFLKSFQPLDEFHKHAFG